MAAKLGARDVSTPAAAQPEGGGETEAEPVAQPATASSKKSYKGGLTVDDERVDRLKEQLRSTPQVVDFERVKIMAEVCEEMAGYQTIIRRARFLETLLERKKIYIDDNLFVGSMAGSVNAIYTWSSLRCRAPTRRR